MPLKAQVAAPSPKVSPKIACHRFCPRYGMLVDAPASRKRFRGEYIQIPIAIPRIAATVPAPELQMTNRLHSG